MAEPKRKPLWQRALNKATGLAEKGFGKVLGGTQSPIPISADPLLVKPPRLPAATSQQVQEVTGYDRRKKARFAAENLWRAGVPDTRPDVYPEPLPPEAQQLYNDYRDKQRSLGKSEQQIRDEVYQITQQNTGAPTVVLPPGYRPVQPLEYDQRDPYKAAHQELDYGNPFEMDPKNPETAALIQQILGLPLRR